MSSLFDLLEPVPKPAPAIPVAPAVQPAPKVSQEMPGQIVRCESIAAARAWLTQNGWNPRHGGGYEKGAHGFASHQKSASARLLCLY
jgi:hypothetical protein